MANKLCILSIDALETDDLELLSQLPNFSTILQKGAVVKNIREVYPTLTNVNHVSMITGVTPSKHGIFHNMSPYLPEKHVDWNMVGQNWFWQKSAIQVPTLVDAAKEKGLSTACLSWPTMGGTAPDYNLAEIWPHTRKTLRETYEASCTSNVMELYFDRYLGSFDFRKIYEFDTVLVPIATDIILRAKPDLMLMHIIGLDYCRHKYGNHNPRIGEALKRADDVAGELISTYQKAGIFDQTNFVFLGDHGQMDINQSFSLNIALKEQGLVRMNQDDLVGDFDAYSFSAGFSTLIILKNPSDQACRDRVYQALQNIQEAYPAYLERVYTAEEALIEEQFSGDFSFVVEAKEGICFNNHFDGPLILSAKSPEYNEYRSNHGYHPSKGPKPVLLSFGPDIREGVAIEHAHVLDECPTFAKLIGAQMSGLMGNPLDILR